MVKIGRQFKIIELINRYEIETQEELVSRLREEGFNVTQATVSRDIRDMKLTKVAGENGHARYAVLQTEDTGLNEKFLRVLRDGYLSADAAENLLVIRTVPGMAMAVAAAVDAMAWPEIAGCIAGDDTIFCALRHRSQSITVMEKLHNLAS